ncbi:hypothetical protein T492DRAFT_17811 [Pavlovales sp. CCMP2436]|nr:hypothetical protein T492DRAFT_17811 [Pavlovales sp. CCMP2436]
MFSIESTPALNRLRRGGICFNMFNTFMLIFFFMFFVVVLFCFDRQHSTACRKEEFVVIYLTCLCLYFYLICCSCCCCGFVRFCRQHSTAWEKGGRYRGSRAIRTALLRLRLSY